MQSKETLAIERLKFGEQMSLKLYQQPLLIAYSGGKDSDVLLHLAAKAGIKYEVLHSLTTTDAPETIYHVKSVFRALTAKGVRCEIDMHLQPSGVRLTMWDLIVKKLYPPTRLARYCCEVLKEGGGKDRLTATGVRWAESKARAKNRGKLEIIKKEKSKSIILTNDNDEDRKLIETCQLKGKRMVNPIVDWTNDDVKEYITTESIEINPLYACGFDRVGCIGCPMAGRATRLREFALYPKYKQAYIKAFGRMVKERKRRGKNTLWENGVDVYHWWMEDDVLSGQEVLNGFEEI